jgi:hypothetical protein
MNPPASADEESTEAENHADETNLEHSYKMDTESHLPLPLYPDASLPSDSLQGPTDNNANNSDIPAQEEACIEPNFQQNSCVPPVIANQPNDEGASTSLPISSPVVHIKEEPESNPSISIDVDAPEPSLYEQLGLPDRTSGAYRVSPPPSKGSRAEWLAQITEQIKWVRGRESGLKPLKIGRVFFR